MIKKMTKKEKQEIRQLLLDRKERIVRKLSEFYNESKDIEINVAQDLVDKAESSYTKEFLLSLSDAEREQLILIDGALRRLDGDEYGVCQRCRREIGRKRLEVLPWAPLCINCQAQTEEESQVL